MSFHIYWSQKCINFLKKFSSSIPSSHQTPIITSQIPDGRSTLLSPSISDVFLLKSDQFFVLLLDITSFFSQKHSLTYPYHQQQGQVQITFWMKLYWSHHHFLNSLVQSRHSACTSVVHSTLYPTFLYPSRSTQFPPLLSSLLSQPNPFISFSWNLGLIVDALYLAGNQASLVKRLLIVMGS